ncbi:MAG: glutamate synthase central domain-containing protein [Gallintestinimicrobium sp.]
MKAMLQSRRCWQFPPYTSIWSRRKNVRHCPLSWNPASRGVHDFAALLGYGACAVNPYLPIPPSQSW